MLTHSTAAKNAAADSVVDLLDAGAGAAKLKLLTSGDSLLVTLTCSDPAFLGAALGIATADTISHGTAVADGTAAKFQLTDSDDTVVVSGTVGKKYAVTGVHQGNKTFSVAQDLSSLAAGDRIRITGSTGNDGRYIVVSVSGAGPTTITVVEAIADATVDGYVNPYDLTVDNTNIATGQTVSVTSLTYQGETQ